MTTNADNSLHATTVLGVLRDGVLAMAGDGQVTQGTGMVLKHGAHKVRAIHHGRVLAGFAGGVADAFALFEAFEEHLEARHGDLERAAVELARDWRSDRQLRRLEAMLLVGDSRQLLLVAGTGEVVTPDDGVLAIGSGGPYALSAARALLRHTAMAAEAIARAAMAVAAEICVYTNDRVEVLTLGPDAAAVQA
jgi:ATP-dependent HslUV protease subunit HslV